MKKVLTVILAAFVGVMSLNVNAQTTPAADKPAKTKKAPATAEEKAAKKEAKAAAKAEKAAAKTATPAPAPAATPAADDKAAKKAAKDAKKAEKAAAKAAAATGPAVTTAPATAPVKKAADKDNTIKSAPVTTATPAKTTKEVVKADPATEKKAAGADKVFGKDEKGRTIYEGPRGGHYYVNGNGNKTYISKDKQ